MQISPVPLKDIQFDQILTRRKMFCIKCGSKNPDSAQFCCQCGQAIWHDTVPSVEYENATVDEDINTPAPVPVPVPEQPIVGVSKPSDTSSVAHVSAVMGPIGVKGLLLGFCVSLTIVGPLVDIVVMTSAWQSLAPYFLASPGLKKFIIYDWVISILFLAFGIYAGVLLWRIRPGAVAVAKAFLIGTFFVRQIVLFFILFSISNLSDEMRNAVIQDRTKAGVQGFIAFLVFFAYINTSRRVWNTYQSSTMRDWLTYTNMTYEVIFEAIVFLVLIGTIVVSNL